MRQRFWRRALLAALCLLLTASAAAETWMYAVSAGKADAILLGGDGWAALVDAGYARSRGKILAAMRQMGVTRLDAVFLTHTDRDHAEDFSGWPRARSRSARGTPRPCSWA